MARQQHLPVIVLCVLVCFLTLSYFFSDTPAVSRVIRVASDRAESVKPEEANTDTTAKAVFDGLPAGLAEDKSIAPKLENATLKAELGRATWKFLHTMAARFPEKPTLEQRQTLENFFRHFGYLYPCGDCAKHFRKVLEKYPPQTSSRNSAAGWLCFVHNLVNKRLKKPDFDCNKIGDFYDCGCADEGKDDTDRGKQKGTAKQGKKQGRKGADEETELEIRGRKHADSAEANGAAAKQKFT